MPVSVVGSEGGRGEANQAPAWGGSAWASAKAAWFGSRPPPSLCAKGVPWSICRVHSPSLLNNLSLCKALFFFLLMGRNVRGNSQLQELCWGVWRFENGEIFLTSFLYF